MPQWRLLIRKNRLKEDLDLAQMDLGIPAPESGAEFNNQCSNRFTTSSNINERVLLAVFNDLKTKFKSLDSNFKLLQEVNDESSSAEVGGIMYNVRSTTTTEMTSYTGMMNVSQRKII